MPIRFSRMSTDPVIALCECDGEVTPEDAIAGMRAAYAQRIYVPGRPRIVRARPAASFNALDLAALERIRDLEVAEETREGGPPAFRVALVAGSLFQQGVAQLYRSVWAQLEEPGVRYEVVATMAEALAYHGARVGARVGVPG